MVGGMLADMIGGVVAGTSGGGLRFAQFLMGGGKEGFEMGPGLFGWILLLPNLAIVIELSSLENQLKSDANNLQRV